MPDDVLLHYRILRPLGSGAMGEVVLAEDLHLHRRVALKFIAPGAATDPESLARLAREARALASLSHPNIAAVHALEHAAGRHFLVMEYVDGQSLAERLQDGALAANDVVS